MTEDKAYKNALRKIENARRDGAPFLNLSGNHLTALPPGMSQLERLQALYVDDNPFGPELEAAVEGGIDAVRAYLRAQAEQAIVLKEAKLVLVGEGGVGKTSLLSALKGERWVEERKTTHGIEVDLSLLDLSEPRGGAPVSLNGWDFGGQPIYRHTHQLFFTAPAIYLVVWNPRRGPEQCCVDEWMRMVKQRAYDDEKPVDRPRFLVVATHGGPTERLAHIDQPALRADFGDMIAGFYHVDSKTGHGLADLKTAIV